MVEVVLVIFNNFRIPNITELRVGRIKVWTNSKDIVCSRAYVSDASLTIIWCGFACCFCRNSVLSLKWISFFFIHLSFIPSPYTLQVNGRTPHLLSFYFSPEIHDCSFYIFASDRNFHRWLQPWTFSMYHWFLQPQFLWAKGRAVLINSTTIPHFFVHHIAQSLFSHPLFF